MPDNVDPQVSKTVRLPASDWEWINDFRFRKRMQHQADAFRAVVRRGRTVIQRELELQDDRQQSSG